MKNKKALTRNVLFEKTTTQSKPVIKGTRCSRYSFDGTQILCPKCNGIVVVYHFSWCAITCQICREMVDKYDWRVVV
jgi:ribosomal protein S27E